MNTPKLASMNELIEALKGQDYAADIFCMNSMNKLKNQASFLLGTCTEDADGNVTISLGVFAYSTTDPIDNPLFTSISSVNAKFIIASFRSITLVEYLYKELRDLIIEKLGNRSKARHIGESLTSNVWNSDGDVQEIVENLVLGQA